MKIALDLDSTVAEYFPGDFLKYGPMIIGKPIPKMVRQVQSWLRQDDEVVIYTARDPIAFDVIRDWTEEHIGTRLDVTNAKTHDLDKFIDDKAFHVIANTGEIIDEARLKELLESEKRLNCLERHGVDNWDYYGDAMSELYGDD